MLCQPFINVASQQNSSSTHKLDQNFAPVPHMIWLLLHYTLTRANENGMHSDNTTHRKREAMGWNLWMPDYTDTNWWEIWQVIDNRVVFAKKSSFFCIPFYANHRRRSEIPVNKPCWIKPFSDERRSLILFPCIFSPCQRKAPIVLAVGFPFTPPGSLPT